MMFFPVADSAYVVNAGGSSYTSGAAVGVSASATASASLVAAAQQSGISSVLPDTALAPSAITALSSTQAGNAAGYGLYNADGLLSANATGLADGSVLQQAVDKEIVASLSVKAVGAGVYNGTGVLESLPYSRVTDLGSLLRYNPQLSYIQVGNSYNQGILESLDIIA